LKEIDEFTARDFEDHPVWRVSTGDSFLRRSRVEITDTTYSPWKGPITKETIWPRSKLLVAGVFRFADGSVYPGYFQLVGTNWDDPLPPRKLSDGSIGRAPQWSARRGGDELSILSLIAPEIFHDGSLMNFHLHPVLPVRETHIRVFYGLFSKTPSETFPVHFETKYGTNETVNSGVIPGFYRFPLDKPHEIVSGEDVLKRFAKRQGGN
jgi:hypothetical protein